jgi:hypothetical protein
MLEKQECDTADLEPDLDVGFFLPEIRSARRYILRTITA